MDPSKVPSIIGWTLIHTSWITLGIYFVALVCKRAFARDHPAGRHVIGLLALAAIACCFLSVAVYEAGQTGHKPPIASQLPFSRNVAHDPPALLNSELIRDPLGRVRYPETDAPGVFDRASITIEPFLPYAVTAWASVFLCLTLWHLVGLIAVNRLVAEGTPVNAFDLARWSSAGTVMGITRHVCYLKSDKYVVPFTVGWLKPAVLLPVHLMTQFSVLEIDAMVAHELAHVKRFDFLTHQFVLVMSSLFFFHPCVWHLRRSMDCDKEYCCDAMAAKALGDPRHIMAALVRVGELRLSSSSQFIAAITGGSLEARVVALSARQRGHMSGWAIMVAMFLGTASIGAVGADVLNRASTAQDWLRMAATPESVFVADVLNLPPATDHFASALIDGLGAAKSRSPIDDPRVTAVARACNEGVDFDLVWNAYLLAFSQGQYPTTSREFPRDWPFYDSGTQRMLARMLWRRAKAQASQEESAYFTRAALAIASMKRETSGITALLTIITDPVFESVSGYDSGTVSRLRRYVSTSSDALGSAFFAESKYEKLLAGEAGDPLPLLDTIALCGTRAPELSYVLTARTNAAVPSKCRALGLKWLRTIAPNNGVVQRNLALGTTPSSQNVFRPVVGTANGF